jgi:hypothetical protein
MRPISKQWIGKHASSTIEVLLEMVFSIRSMQIGYKEENWDDPIQLRVEGWQFK